MRERGWACIWILQCRVNREKAQGHQPLRRLSIHKSEVATSIGGKRFRATKTSKETQPLADIKLKPASRQASAFKRLTAEVRKTTLLTEVLNSMSHYNLARELCLIPEAIKITDAMASFDKEWEN